MLEEARDLLAEWMGNELEPGDEGYEPWRRCYLNRVYALLQREVPATPAEALEAAAAICDGYADDWAHMGNNANAEGVALAAVHLRNHADRVAQQGHAKDTL